MILFTVQILLWVLAHSLCNGVPVYSRSRRFASDPLDILRSYARERLSGSKLFMLYDRINNLRNRRSLPDNAQSRRDNADMYRNKTHGREIEYDTDTFNNSSSTFKITSPSNSDRKKPSGAPNAPQRSTTTQRPWNPRGVPAPPSGPVRPVQPTLNVIPTIQAGVVPTGNRTSFFVGYYRPNYFGPRGGSGSGGSRGGTGSLLPRLTTSISTFYPYYPGYYYPWYNYGTSFNFPFYSSFPGYPQYQQQYPQQQPQTFLRPRQMPVASAPQNRGPSGGQQQQQRGLENNYAVFYRPQPDDAGTVQYSYVPVDEVLGGIRRAASQIFGFLSRRFGNRPGAYVECRDCAQPGQVMQALHKKTSTDESRSPTNDPIQHLDKTPLQEQPRALKPQKGRQQK